LSVFVSTSGFSQGQGPLQKGAGRAASPVRRKPQFQPQFQPQFKSTRDRWFSLSPEDRQSFRRNAERWMQMGPQERNLMRAREKVHREQLKREAEKALRAANLRLDQEKRDLFEQRYFQERRRIERELRQEVEMKRQQQLPALEERLKKEFQEPSPGVKSAPPISVTPNH